MSAPGRTTVVATDGSQWEVRVVFTTHSGRCGVCQRPIPKGGRAYLAHATAFCLQCPQFRGTAVADRVKFAREQRSVNQ